MQQTTVPCRAVFMLALATATICTQLDAFAQPQPTARPAWLEAHLGEGDGQIAATVLDRARALYLSKSSTGAVHNPCYFAMDATRPNLQDDASGGRFYIICEASRSFRAIAAGHGAGRSLDGVADFANDRLCARHFGNAMDSNLTSGGAYVTGEAKTSFKGFHRLDTGGDAPFFRTFIPFDGEGESANARRRAIGGHAASALKDVCLRRDPSSPFADAEGYVPFGQLVDYTGGRSDGCTSWSPVMAERIVSMVQGAPTTLYIYPEAADVRAVATAIGRGQTPASGSPYWNATCLARIQAPRYWPKDELEPLIARYRQQHPSPPPRRPPLCSAR